MLFQSMGGAQYRSSFDREMYVHHLEVAHGVRLSDEQSRTRSVSGGVLNG